MNIEEKYTYNENELDSPETLEAVETMITSSMESQLNNFSHMNRAQKRATLKKIGKKGRGQLGTISETARKLTYIDLIQKLRKLNEEKVKENNDNETIN